MARTLFLLGRYRESRALFEAVLLDPRVPWQVRENVEGFLRQIDEAEGYVRFAVSLLSDSNPRSLSSQREFTIGGFRLNFVPPADNERVTGLRHAVQAMHPIERAARLSAYLTGSYLDYPNATFDRLTVDFGLAKGVGESGRTSVRAGMEVGTFSGEFLYQFPYAGLEHVISASALHRVTGELRLGRVDFPDHRFLDARYSAAALSASRALPPAVTLVLDAALERSDAEEKPFSYTGVSLGWGVSWLVTGPALLAKVVVSYGERDYAAPDPFFGPERSDRKTRLGLSVRGKQWRVFDLRPGLSVSLERNRSSIDFYEYEKVNASITLE